MYLFQVAALLVEGSLCQEDADSVRENKTLICSGVYSVHINKVNLP